MAGSSVVARAVSPKAGLSCLTASLVNDDSWTFKFDPPRGSTIKLANKLVIDNAAARHTATGRGSKR